MAAVLNISALEKRTGVSRSTIHFYIREGLLPQPQKTAASRSLYSEDHVRLLLKVVELKGAGRSLAAIRAALAEDLAEAEKNDVDLAGQRSEQTRRAILRVATEEFIEKGYRRTHVATIIRKLGITPQVFYSHFPSKGRLLAESFHTYIQWNLAFVEPKLMESTDLGERLLWRVLADLHANEFGSEVLSLVRTEKADAKDLARYVEQAWEGIIERIVADFESVRPPDSAPLPISLELLAHAMIGAHHNASLRASWDDTYTRVDLLRAHLWTWLAILAALSGEVDIDSRLPHYEELIQQVAAREPEAPPALEE